MDADQIRKLLDAEFGIHGHHPPPIRVKKLAARLVEQEIEIGSVAISTAVIGYLVAMGHQ